MMLDIPAYFTRHPEALPETDYEPWEPWTPKEGDRVRVRLRGECLYSEDKEYAARRHAGCHLADADGHTGIVDSVSYRDTGQPPITGSHHYEVTFEAPRPVGLYGGNIIFGHYAAIELVPVEKPRFASI